MSSRKVNLLEEGHHLVADLADLRGQVLKDRVSAPKAAVVTQVAHATCRAIKTTIDTDQWLTRKAVLKVLG